MRLRLLSTGDIPDALELSIAAGWNQTPTDWAALLETAPEGCFGIECDGRIVATTTLVSYGKRLAWIGMVLTHADYRRRGFARLLVQEAVDLARSRQVAIVKLDATDEGRRLYEECGFRAEQPIERWALGEPMVPQPALDAPPIKEPGGQLLHRPGYRAHYLGPCTADSPEIAGRLFQRAIDEIGASNYFWDILPLNRSALRIATRLGFAPLRRLTRMVLGRETQPYNESHIYAIAGFEWG
jgi:GNAT superfamily N-acetyltransferase